MISYCTVFGEKPNNVGGELLVHRIFDTFEGVLGFHVVFPFHLCFSYYSP